MAIKYTIKRGDTVSAIAEKYGVSVAAIREANRNIIKDVNLIRTGWVITIPTPEPPETPVKPTKPTDAEVGAAFRDVMEEIEKLPAFKRFMKVI